MADAASLGALAASLKAAGQLLDAARTEHDRAARALEAMADPAPESAASSLAFGLAEHRRQHRSGTPSVLDAELRAFMVARIDRMTFRELTEALAAAFRPGRRTSISGLHR